MRLNLLCPWVVNGFFKALAHVWVQIRGDIMVHSRLFSDPMSQHRSEIRGTRVPVSMDRPLYPLSNVRCR